MYSQKVSNETKTPRLDFSDEETLPDIVNEKNMRKEILRVSNLELRPSTLTFIPSIKALKAFSHSQLAIHYLQKIHYSTVGDALVKVTFEFTGGKCSPPLGTF